MIYLGIGAGTSLTPSVEMLIKKIAYCLSYDNTILRSGGLSLVDDIFLQTYRQKNTEHEIYLPFSNYRYYTANDQSNPNETIHCVSQLDPILKDRIEDIAKRFSGKHLYQSNFTYYNALNSVALAYGFNLDKPVKFAITYIPLNNNSNKDALLTSDCRLIFKLLQYRNISIFNLAYEPDKKRLLDYIHYKEQQIESEKIKERMQFKASVQAGLQPIY